MPEAPLSLEAELAAAFAGAAPTETETVAENPPEEAAAGDPAAGANPEAKVEEKTPEPAKVEPSLARRLAMVAKAERDAKAKTEREAAEAKARAGEDEKTRLALDRLSKAKSAKSRMEAAKLALDLDDEAMAELFLELNDHHARGGQPKDPKEELETLVEKKLTEKLRLAEEEKDRRVAAHLDTQRELYTKETLTVLEEKGADFPLVAIAPPSQGDITAISEAILLEEGAIPEPERVLKLIQDEREERRMKLDKSRKAEKVEGTAPAKAGEAGGKKATSARRDDVPVSPPRKLTLIEELEDEFKREQTRASQ